MRGQMMDFQLTLPHILRRVETYFPDKEVVTRLPDKSFHRYGYRDLGAARQAARGRAARASGSSAGDRVATLCWNHYQHHEAYLGIPCGGFVLHTLNLRLHPNDLAYIATHAGDRAVIVDRSLLPLLETFRAETDDRARLRRRGLVRGAARRRVGRRLARPRARRERRGGDVLHERDDRPAEGRRLLAPLDDAAHARRRRREPARARRLRGRRDPAGRADVPRERVGLSVSRDDVRGEDRLPRAAPRPRVAARRLRAGGRDVGGGRADDLDGHPRDARREPRPLGSLEA